MLPIPWIPVESPAGWTGPNEIHRCSSLPWRRRQLQRRWHIPLSFDLDCSFDLASSCFAPMHRRWIVPYPRVSSWLTKERTHLKGYIPAATVRDKKPPNGGIDPEGENKKVSAKNLGRLKYTISWPPLQVRSMWYTSNFFKGVNQLISFSVAIGCFLHERWKYNIYI